MDDTVKTLSVPRPGQTPQSGGSRRAKRSLHPLEMVLATLLALNLCYLPWAFGGVDVWSQVVSAGLSLVTLAVAMVPRSASVPAADSGAPHGPARVRLLKFPVFWAGLVLFGYVAVQGLNPAFEYHLAGTAWWLARRPFLGWLPAGMAVPYAEMSPWRELVVWFSPWATACAIWVGVTRRRTVLHVLNAVVVNAFAFGAFGLVQRASGTSVIYGLRPVPISTFFAALIYKNHAAAFFILTTSVALGLAGHFIWRNQSASERPGPSILFVFFALALMLAVGLTFSFSGITLLFLLLIVVGPVTAWRITRVIPTGTAKAPAIVSSVVLLGLVAGLGAAVGIGSFRDKLEARFAQEGYQMMRPRWLAARQGWAMWADRPFLGWGAGCFRYGFTKYQHVEPELTHTGLSQYKWEHVHDDWLEFLIELGVVGFLPIAFMLGYWFRHIARLRLWEHPSIFPMLAGLGAIAAYALVDFPFQNPAVLNTGCALVPLLARWGETARRSLPT